MENHKTLNCPLYLAVDDIRILLDRKKSYAYKYMEHLRTLYPDRCKNGKNIPSNVFAEYNSVSLHIIAEALEAYEQKKSVP